LRPSKAIAGATETDFGFTKIAAMSYSKAMVDMLNGMPAAYLKTWETGVRQEANLPGENMMGMVIGQYKEYDLTKVDGDLLFYGERPADAAPDSEEKRASSLQVTLKRVAEFSEL
jgi:hypothetical protein